MTGIGRVELLADAIAVFVGNRLRDPGLSVANVGYPVSKNAAERRVQRDQHLGYHRIAQVCVAIGALCKPMCSL
jgi:hypothetical protein